MIGGTRIGRGLYLFLKIPEGYLIGGTRIGRGLYLFLKIPASYSSCYVHIGVEIDVFSNVIRFIKVIGHSSNDFHMTVS